ncbi:hypothetical protein ACVOMV_05055 [Mesorhizobium atlanticum]
MTRLDKHATAAWAALPGCDNRWRDRRDGRQGSLDFRAGAMRDTGYD